MLNITPEHLVIIQKILSHYPIQAMAFGSRVKGTNRKYSDLDLCLLNTVPMSTVSFLREEFEESNLPFEVDIICWELITEDFRNKIKPDLTDITITINET